MKTWKIRRGFAGGGRNRAFSIARRIRVLAFLVLGCAGFAEAAPQAPAPGTCSPCTVIFFAGQSNMVTVTTLNVPPPSGAAFEATFTGKISAAPLPAATFRIGAKPSYGPTTTTLRPSANSGALSVTSLISGKVRAGEVLTCAGCVAGTVISSDQFGPVNPDGTGSYVVTPAQTVKPGTLFTAMEPDIAAQNPACIIWSVADQAWETYAPGVNSDSGGTRSWGPEGFFCQHWLADHPGANLYMVKYAVGGQSLCANSIGTWSPFTRTSDYLSANKQMTNALAALPAIIGAGGSFSLAGVIWVQGEQDGDEVSLYCNDPVVYKRNLLALVSAFSKPSPVHVTFAGGVDDGAGGYGDVLAASTIVGGPLTPGQYVAIPGLNPALRAFIDHQLTGPTGGAGAYALQVYGVLPSSSVVDVTSGARLTASVSGNVLGVTAIDGGAIAVGDVLSGAGVASGAVVTAFGAGNGMSRAGGVGWYTINVPLKIAPQPLRAGASGWSPGANTARFAYAVSRNYAPSEGVQTAQIALSNAGLAALSMTAIDMYDARQSTTNSTHNDPAWLAELGRRLYLAWKANTQSVGGCDLTSPTC